MTSLQHKNAVTPKLVLASGSKTRAKMLERVGLEFTQETPMIDEDAIKDALQAEGASCEELAEALAEHKAVRISARNRTNLVIGADQILECDGVRINKPENLDSAAKTLRTLSARTHRLISSVVVVLDGDRLWHATDSASLTMRPLDDGFIDHYLGRTGDAVLSSVGAYQLEGFGAHLFTRVNGDFFTVLGLPLLPLLDFLRTRGAAPT